MKTFLAIVSLLSLSLYSAAEVIDGQFAVTSNLKVGVAKVNITPTDVSGITVIGHRREVTGVRDRLRAGVLILDDGETKAAIVTMDTIGAWEEMVKLARAGIEKETGVPAANIMICASHNHSGPGYVENLRWASDLIIKLTAAAKEAAGNMRTVSIGYSEDAISFGINRRKTYDGRAAAYMCCPFVESTWTLVACCAVVSFCTDLANPALWAFMGDVGGRATAAAGGWGNMWGNFGASAGAMLIPWLMKLGGGDGKTIVFFTLAGAFVLAGLIVLPMDATKKLIADEPAPSPS